MQHFPCCERTQHEYLIHRVGSLPSFAAQSTNGHNAENQPFAALVANVLVAYFSAFRGAPDLAKHMPGGIERTDFLTSQEICFQDFP